MVVLALALKLLERKLLQVIRVSGVQGDAVRVVPERVLQTRVVRQVAHVRATHRAAHHRYLFAAMRAQLLGHSATGDALSIGGNCKLGIRDTGQSKGSCSTQSYVRESMTRVRR